MSTLKEIRDQVIVDLDLEEEVWISDSELNSWINEGIKNAEAQIHTLYEDYFLVESDPIVITQGQYLVEYPSDVYASKIRKIIFTDGLGASNTNHEVKRIRNILDGATADLYSTNSTNPILEWTNTNKLSEGRKIRLFPNTGRGGYLHIWYIRNVSELVNDEDISEIDEFDRYVVQYVKTKVFLKDGDPRTADSKILEEQYKSDVITTLSNMVQMGTMSCTWTLIIMMIV
jgi:hypothetical protein